MTARQMLNALHDFSGLETISASELRVLTDTYPYCANLHLLYTYKLHQNGDPAFTQSLEMSALHTLDRALLGENIKALSAFLQRKSPFPLETLSAAEAPSGNPLSWHSGSESLMEKIMGAPSHYKVERSTLGLLTSVAALFDPPQSRPQLGSKAPENPLARRMREKPLSAAQPVRPAPEPAISPEELQQVADESIAAPPLATETLAKILAMQGQVEKAIEMYKQLILIFPEKKTYFAAAIEKLKNL